VNAFKEFESVKEAIGNGDVTKLNRRLIKSSRSNAGVVRLPTQRGEIDYGQKDPLSGIS